MEYIVCIICFFCVVKYFIYVVYLYLVEIIYKDLGGYWIYGFREREEEGEVCFVFFGKVKYVKFMYM